MTSPIDAWQHAEVDGKEVAYFEPAGNLSPERAVIFLPSRDADADFLRSNLAEELTRHQLPCVCLAAGHHWWVDRVVRAFDEQITPLEYVRENILTWIRHRWSILPPQIGLLGVGMGGQGALQLAYRHARQFPVVAAISPAIDFHILHGRGTEIDDLFEDPEAARQETVTLHLHPLGWPPHQLLVSDPSDPLWHEGSERLASKLASMGIPFVRDFTAWSADRREDYVKARLPCCVDFVANGLQAVAQRSG